MYPSFELVRCPACGRPAAMLKDSIKPVNHAGTDCDCCPKVKEDK